MLGSTGLLNAQANINLAMQTQNIAGRTSADGMIRERQGITSGSAKAVEEGKALQLKGDEIKGSAFEHLGKANNNIKAAAAETAARAKEREEAEKTASAAKTQPAAAAASRNTGSTTAAVQEMIADSINSLFISPAAILEICGKETTASVASAQTANPQPASKVDVSV